ncbi:uncharacterized protein LOC143216083 isoform X2 [Lasioglossum baleicum]|uniref:uncharacterized protein LOC143216083 isoform X2 n=1 Tax=Lasioglossum baleicum TaxID=434251 RepID=UPI003FCE93AA
MQHETNAKSDTKSRSKLTAQLRKVPPGQRKGFKNKVSTAVKFDSSCPTKQNPWVVNSPKKKKKSTESKGSEPNSKMQPESETVEIKVDETLGNKSCAKPETSKEIQNSTEQHVDRAASEPVQASSKEEEQRNGEPEKDQTDTEKTEEKLKKSVETKQVEVHVEREEAEETDLKLSLENDENSEKPREEKIGEEPKSKENEEVRIETESRAQENDEAQSVSLNDTESSTVELAESLKSDLTEVSESTSQNEERNEREKVEETTTEKEESFVSYDPAIMLKDVQIKLNDCMKESSKMAEASAADQQAEQDQDQESTLPPRPSDDLSFGKTLRNISGRRSLGRMRHVTIREQRYSPNNSMFVNTSGTSLMPDENEDFKILRYNTGVSETISASNGSSMEKKRKHETIEDRAGKKQKTETENSMFNTSISLLKGLRRPIQASTPVAELKFQSNKLDLLDDERDKSVNDHQAPKKWCAFM